VLTGDNVVPIHQAWRIRFGETWQDEEMAMLATIDIEPVVE
jgi:hypothetical protein